MCLHPQLLFVFGNFFRHLEGTNKYIVGLFQCSMSKVVISVIHIIINSAIQSHAN